MQTKAPSENQSPSETRSLPHALNFYRARLEAMPDESLGWTRGLDVSVCVSIVRGRFPTIRLHREAVLAHFGEQRVALLDELPRLADATLEAHLAWAGSVKRVDFAPLHEALRQDHAMLWGDAQSLAHRKLIDRKRLAVARSTHGYQQTVQSVEILVLILRGALLRGVSTPLRLEDLNRIQQSAQEFDARLCVRQLRKERFPAKELRERMLNLLLRAYDEVRRMLHFVRWHEDDADAIAPSLWMKTGRSKRQAKGPRGARGGGKKPTPNGRNESA